eukprot:914229-Prymnesium_polylepis.1
MGLDGLGADDGHARPRLPRRPPPRLPARPLEPVCLGARHGRGAHAVARAALVARHVHRSECRQRGAR